MFCFQNEWTILQVLISGKEAQAVGIAAVQYVWLTSQQNYIPGQGNPEVDTFPDTPALLRWPSNGAQQLHTAILCMVLPS